MNDDIGNMSSIVNRLLIEFCNESGVNKSGTGLGDDVDYQRLPAPTWARLERAICARNSGNYSSLQQSSCILLVNK